MPYLAHPSTLGVYVSSSDSSLSSPAPATQTADDLYADYCQSLFQWNVTHLQPSVGLSATRAEELRRYYNQLKPISGRANCTQTSGCYNANLGWSTSASKTTSQPERLYSIADVRDQIEAVVSNGIYFRHVEASIHQCSSASSSFDRSDSSGRLLSARNACEFDTFDGQATSKKRRRTGSEEGLPVSKRAK